MTIHITEEAVSAYKAYLDTPIDFDIRGTPIYRRNTYPFLGSENAELISFSAGYQAARQASTTALNNETPTASTVSANQLFDEFFAQNRKDATQAAETPLLPEARATLTPLCDELESIRKAFEQRTSAPYLSLLRLAQEMEKELVLKAEIPPKLEEVLGDQLPPVGASVGVYLGSSKTPVPHKVVGYYAWGDLKGDSNLHRLFVRVVDSAGYFNSRLLKDVQLMPATTHFPAEDSAKG